MPKPGKPSPQKVLISEDGFVELNHETNNSNFVCEIDGSA